jgi:two-component system response regulator WspF
MKIAIVSSSSTVSRVLSAILKQDPALVVGWRAQDGAAAIERCAMDPPNLLLLDLGLAGIDGVETTRRIMASTPCAILLVTATPEDDTSAVFEAMGWGALDVVATPTLSEGGEIRGGEALLKKISTVRKLLGASASRSGAPAGKRGAAEARRLDPLVVVGASTGGPRALSTVLAGLPEDFEGAVVIVQHIDATFAANLAGWLNERAPLDIRVAREGDIPTRGQVLLATGPDHLVMGEDGKLGYVSEPLNCPYQPSVDVFFGSLPLHWHEPGVAVLLTGMGRDGAKGMLALRNAGWHTIAQDQKTSTIFGMPRAAIDQHAVEQTLPLDEIAPAILSQVTRVPSDSE